MTRRLAIAAIAFALVVTGNQARPLIASDRIVNTTRC
jgi:hypothetical protein